MTDATQTPQLGGTEKATGNGKAAAPSGAAVPRSKTKLPRLGSPEAQAKAPETREVEIPDRGVSLLLKKPSVAAVIDVQSEVAEDPEANLRQSFELTVRLVAQMLVEPKMDEEPLRKEVESWSMTDWMVLQTATSELAGLDEETGPAAQAEFRNTSD